MIEQPNILLILNPVAGRGRSLKMYRRLEQFLQKLPARLTMVCTERPVHAFELARTAARSGRGGLIVAMGGDGTVNEVINGLMSVAYDERPALGILPTGRGADFSKARGVRLPTDLREAARTLVGSHEVRLDVGRATFEPGDYAGLEPAEGRACRYFLNVASLGFDAAVTEEANRPPVGWRRVSSYYSSIFVTLRTYTNRRVTYRLDGQTHTGVFNSVIAANGNYYGGGMRIAPGADPRDGQFEIVLLGDVNRVEILAVAPLLYPGWHRFHPKANLLSGQRLEIEPDQTDKRLPIQLDGEMVGQAPASFEIVPGALRLKVP